jgi:hypothetical protein
MPHQAEAVDAVSLLQKLTSFMALRDPELLAVAAAALGTEAFAPIFGSASTQSGDAYPDCLGGPTATEALSRHQPLAPNHPRKWEEEGATKMRQQEAELAQFELEAESTRRKIIEARRRAEEAATLAAAASAREVAREQKAAEEAKADEARRELQREQAARASALAAEAAKLAATQALAEAREHEHKIAVLVAKAQKEENYWAQSHLMG